MVIKIRIVIKKGFILFENEGGILIINRRWLKVLKIWKIKVINENFKDLNFIVFSFVFCFCCFVIFIFL